MARDRSLDEFARADSDSDGDDGDDGGADAADDPASADDDPNFADPEPAVSTYAFSPGGAACAACGETVEKRWRDESGLVCGDCKAW
ncbi:DUF7573 domain-containing protein [Halorarius halobius]|uniref:DUF7573 domain-containing protein n=1 Tax=Halorarius halobius TaxID=2962671 RepID=UPI0020CF1AD9|nr:hypothetical protein [Halorarius halobius]